MAPEYPGYDYEEEPVMYDSPEDNFADLNESPDYEALSDRASSKKEQFWSSLRRICFPGSRRRGTFFTLSYDGAS
jgi:hypothetical protein